MDDKVTTTPAPGAESKPPIQKRLAQFIALRDRIKDIKAKHEAELKPFNDALLALNGVLLEYLNQTGADSFVVRDVGTFYKSVKKSATIADSEVFKRFVIGGGHWECVDMRANAPGIEAFLKREEMLPPGINFRQVAVVGVRRAGAKDED